MTETFINLTIVTNRQRAEHLTKESMRSTAGITFTNELSCDIVVVLNGVWKAARKHHRPFEEEFVRTLEHEFVHALGANDEHVWSDEIFNLVFSEGERVAWEFEDAGGWARGAK